MVWVSGEPHHRQNCHTSAGRSDTTTTTIRNITTTTTATGILHLVLAISCHNARDDRVLRSCAITNNHGMPKVPSTGLVRCCIFSIFGKNRCTATSTNICTDTTAVHLWCSPCFPSFSVDDNEVDSGEDNDSGYVDEWVMATNMMAAFCGYTSICSLLRLVLKLQRKEFGDSGSATFVLEKC